MCPLKLPRKLPRLFTSTYRSNWPTQVISKTAYSLCVHARVCVLLAAVRQWAGQCECQLSISTCPLLFRGNSASFRQDIRWSKVSGSVLRSALKNPPASPSPAASDSHYNAANSASDRPNQRYSPHGHSETQIYSLTYSPTAAVSSLGFLTHTLTHFPPSATDQAFCPSLLLTNPLTPPPHLLLSSSHLALRWLPTQEAFMARD